MQTLKSFLDQSLLIWKDSTAAARFGLVLLLVICVGGIVGVGIWSTQPNYVILASNLNPDTAGKIIDKLDSAGISYQVKGTGSIILVDSRNLPRAEIAASKFGIRSESANLKELSPWMDPLNQQNILRQNLEKQLTGSLQKFPAISSANVLLSIPKIQPFLRHSTQPSASVVLEIAPNALFGESQAASIARIVAHSVPGLTLDRVALTDTQGNEYVTDESLGQLNRQEDHRLMRDRELAHKAESMLTPFLGFGNAHVEVSTDFTFKSGKLTTIEFDPKKKVVIKEEINSVTESKKAGASGTAGSGSDLGAASGGSGKSQIISKTEDQTAEYVPSTTELEETSTAPTLNKVSVSASVNLTALKEDTSEMRERIENVVKNAVGFSEDTDQISVEYFEFVVAPEIEAPAFAMPWDQINELLKNLSLGIAAIIAFFVARMAFKKMQPDPTAAPELANRDSQVVQLSDLVKQNPEVFSKIMESWSNLDSNKQGSDEQLNRAA